MGGGTSFIFTEERQDTMCDNMFSSFDISKFSNLSCEQLIEIAKLAEAAERYENMCCFMKTRVVAHGDTKLSVEERNLLSVAYKNVISSRRTSIRAMYHEQGVLSEEQLNTYCKQVQVELVAISKDVLDLLESHLIAKEYTSQGAEYAQEQVFYLKMAADYYRYLTESAGQNEEEYKSQTEAYYLKAAKIADELDEVSPIRLGLALNFSVCYYEILKNPEKACEMAKTAFDNAIQKLDSLHESEYKDSTLIMQLLRDNLTLWTSDSEQEQDVKVEELE